MYSGARAQLREWRITDPAVQASTTRALERYFSVVRPDSLRLRYLARNAGIMPYRVRGLAASPRADGARGGTIVSVSIGQLIVFPEDNVRVAVGEDLLAHLLDARTRADADDHAVGDDGFGHDDWDAGHTAIVSLDRIDLHLARAFGVYAELGAPESNLRWWNDGTASVGIATPNWSVAVLVPVAGGLTPIGTLHARLLAPAWGGTAEARAGALRAYARFATPGEPTFTAFRVAPDYYVHTISAQLVYRHLFDDAGGTLRLDAGLGHEEFSQVLLDGDSVRSIGHVRRLSPVVELAWTNPDRTVQARVGYVDLSPRLSVAARLTNHLWLDAELVAPGLFREVKPFEHASTLFITPRVKF